MYGFLSPSPVIFLSPKGLRLVLAFCFVLSRFIAQAPRALSWLSAKGGFRWQPEPSSQVLEPGGADSLRAVCSCGLKWMLMWDSPREFLSGRAGCDRGKWPEAGTPVAGDGRGKWPETGTPVAGDGSWVGGVCWMEAAPHPRVRVASPWPPWCKPCWAQSFWQDLPSCPRDGLHGFNHSTQGCWPSVYSVLLELQEFLILCNLPMSETWSL